VIFNKSVVSGDGAAAPGPVHVLGHSRRSCQKESFFQELFAGNPVCLKVGAFLMVRGIYFMQHQA